MHYLLIIYSAIVILNLFTSKKPNEILAQSVLDLYEVTIGGTIKNTTPEKIKMELWKAPDFGLYFLALLDYMRLVYFLSQN